MLEGEWQIETILHSVFKFQVDRVYFQEEWQAKVLAKSEIRKRLEHPQQQQGVCMVK